MATDDERRTRILDIEETLAVLQGELGERNDDPKDFGDSAQDLEAREAHDAQIDALENERRTLLEELGEG
jgi:hypothetical protein